MSLFFRHGKRTWLGNLVDAHSLFLSEIGKCPCSKPECKKYFGTRGTFIEGFARGYQEQIDGIENGRVWRAATIRPPSYPASIEIDLSDEFLSALNEHDA